MSHRLRLVAAEGRQDDGVAGLATSVTYGAPFEGWVVLPWHPKDMSGPQHFVALHEIGHTSIEGTAFEGRDVQIRSTYVFLLYAAVEVQGTPPQLAALMFLSIVWVVLSRIQSRYNHRVARLHDEIHADEYALARCNPAWLGNGPALQVANTLCHNQNDRRVSSEETRVRIAAFVENLELVRAGKGTRPAADYLPKRPWGARSLKVLEDVLLATVLISCGLLHAPLTDLRLELLVGTSVLLAGGATAIHFVIQSFISLLDHRFGIKGEATYTWKYAEALIQIVGKLRKT